ncbi:MAG: endonuclease/exonuclease/phosphatase family protein [Fibrobacteres bacterium]|nr:endonuclease/exonuclease/phosphatase family protein [Fibrobacterota bacterium]
MFDRWGLITSDHILYGADMLPPIWPTAILSCALFIIYWIKQKRVFLYLLMLVAANILFVGDIKLTSSGRAKTSEHSTITVLAQNVQYYTNGLNKVFDTILAIKPDIAILGENSVSDSELVLIKKKDTSYAFYQSRRFGPALFTRLPVLSCKEIEFPTYLTSLSGKNDLEKMDRNPRSTFLHAVINVYGTHINIIAVRFIAGRPKENTLRENIRWGHYLILEQIKERDFLVNYIGRLKGPIIFGGDLNATPTSKIIRPLRKITSDVYLACNHIGIPTFKVGRPIQTRLDYLFCSKECIPLEAKVLNTIIADHYPVWAKIGVPKW